MTLIQQITEIMEKAGCFETIFDLDVPRLQAFIGSVNRQHCSSEEEAFLKSLESSSSLTPFLDQIDPQPETLNAFQREILWESTKVKLSSVLQLIEVSREILMQHVRVKSIGNGNQPRKKEQLTEAIESLLNVKGIPDDKCLYDALAKINERAILGINQTRQYPMSSLSSDFFFFTYTACLKAMLVVSDHMLIRSADISTLMCTFHAVNTYLPQRTDAFSGLFDNTDFAFLSKHCLNLSSIDRRFAVKITHDFLVAMLEKAQQYVSENRVKDFERLEGYKEEIVQTTLFEVFSESSLVGEFLSAFESEDQESLDDGDASDEEEVQAIVVGRTPSGRSLVSFFPSGYLEESDSESDEECEGARSSVDPLAVAAGCCK